MIQQLTERQEQAAIYIAQGKPYTNVADTMSVKRATVQRWLKLPAFGSRVSEEAQRIKDAIRDAGIANRQNRIDALNQRHKLMEAVIAARAEANRRRSVLMDQRTGKQLGGLMATGTGSEPTEDRDQIDFDTYAAAGAETGLMVHTVTYLKDGRREEWAVDTGLLKELREHEKQAAIECGQWEEPPAPPASASAVAITQVIVELPASVAPGAMVTVNRPS